MLTTTTSYRARWVFPVTAPPIENGVVTLEDATQRILAVGTTAEGARTVELESAAIIPALVNAHTHLEFSDLAVPLGHPGMGFAAWVRCVIEGRRAAEAAGHAASRAEQAIGQGIAESLSCGVTAVGEIIRPSLPVAPFAEAKLAATLFLELLGLASEREAALQPLAKDFLRGAPPSSRIAPGLSPHAPYTAAPSLVQKGCELSKQFAAPIAMHLAESWDEIELLQSHSGPLVELLTQLGAWYPGLIPRGIEPRHYLEWLATAHRALVIHGNFLQPDDWRFLAEQRDRMTLVHCPRTHAYFARGKLPLRQLLDTGVRVAVGTDSRASNPDLNLFAELQCLYGQHPDVSGEEILLLGTRHAAEALGLQPSYGKVAAGEMSPLAVVELHEGEGGDPYEQLFAPGSQARPLRTSTLE